MQLVWIVILTGLFLYLNSSPPFMAVGSSSMEPILSRGDLIFTSKVMPDTLKEGDIIVFKVPEQFQIKYGYPSSICHRIIIVQNTADRLSFRTKGDAAGEDPFIVLPESVIGKQTTVIPLVGYAIMFPQTVPGIIFLCGLIILLIMYWNSDYVSKSVKNIHCALTGVSNAEFIKSQKELENKIHDMSGQVSQSMNSFASAMSEYAQHIASHTSAIKSLANVAEHLDAVLSKSDYGKSCGECKTVNQPENNQIIYDRTKPIEVTPELKTAVKLFIIEYSRERNLPNVEVTPELRSAVWEFIQQYANEPLEYSSSQSSLGQDEITSDEDDSTASISSDLAS
jgi:signal peptidase I